jgi:hypothetical protein
LDKGSAKILKRTRKIQRRNPYRRWKIAKDLLVGKERCFDR